MDTQVRLAITLEPSTLLAADSFFRQQRPSRDMADTDGAALAVDPGARDQFVRAVDVLLDAPAHYVITAKAVLPQPAPVSEPITATAVKVPDTVNTPLNPAFQILLCKKLLSLVHQSQPFGLAALRWGAFQLLSTDILQGYVVRMDMPFGQPLVDDAAKSAFTEAVLTVNEQGGRSVIEKADSILHNLGLARLLSGPRSSFDSLGLRHLAVGASYLKGLMHEAEGYQDMAKKLALSTDSTLACFLLAYLCREGIRGWQHVTLLSQQRDSPELVYLAHHMRSTFMHQTRQQFAFDAVTPGRLYCWSWGNLLARSMEQDPSSWTARKLSRTLRDLRSILQQEKISTSVDSPDAETTSMTLKDQIRRLQHLARDADIVSEGDEAHDQLAAWAPALGRSLAVLNADRICELLSTLVDEPMSGSLVSALQAGEAEAVRLFSGTGQPSPLPGTVRPHAEKWLAGSRAQLGQLYPNRDASSDERTARVALSPVWAEHQATQN